MKVHLVTYGDSKYTEIKGSFVKSALSSSFFDELHIYSDLDLDPIFYNEIYVPIKSCRGGGFWIWKPYFIKKVLDEIDNDDILIYCDAGSTINTGGRKRFEEYINMLSSPDKSTIDFKLFWREYQYTKQEVFDYFNSPPEIINSPQLHSTILILKKCSHTTLLVNKWYEIAINNPSLFTDEKRVPQHPSFIDHRHDQSVFSIIRKTYGANILFDETSYPDFTREGRLSPFWATQLKP